jgi:transcription elongation GreA/GreB family factor
MNKKDLLILESDRKYALRRIATLQQEIDALGPEFNAAFTQTSETWHDNAPFEIVRDRQAMLYAEHQGLKGILQSSLPSVPTQPKDAVGVGAFVEAIDAKGTTQRYFVAGDWTPFAGKQLPGRAAIVVSRGTPVAQLFLGLKEGDSFTLNRKPYRIILIDYSFTEDYARLAD